MIAYFLQQMSLFLNMFLCLDLIQTLRNPFDVARGRLWKQLTISFLMSFIIEVIVWCSTDQKLPSVYYLNT